MPCLLGRPARERPCRFLSSRIRKAGLVGGKYWSGRGVTISSRQVISSLHDDCVEFAAGFGCVEYRDVRRSRLRTARCNLRVDELDVVFHLDAGDVLSRDLERVGVYIDRSYGAVYQCFVKPSYVHLLACYRGRDSLGSHHDRSDTEDCASATEIENVTLVDVVEGSRGRVDHPRGEMGRSHILFEFALLPTDD